MKRGFAGMGKILLEETLKYFCTELAMGTAAKSGVDLVSC
jgi:hypothetical protein